MGPGKGKGIRGSQPWQDDQGSVDSGPKPWTVRMPPESPFLSSDGEFICVTSPWTNGALCYKFRSIRPPCAELAHSMPANTVSIKHFRTFNMLNLTYMLLRYLPRLKCININMILIILRDVPMNCSVILRVVVHFDFKFVSVSNMKSWTWELSVDSDDIVCST